MAALQSRSRVMTAECLEIGRKHGEGAKMMEIARFVTF